MSLKRGVAVDIVKAAHLGRYRLELTFSDGHVSTVDFGPFLRGSLNPETRRFLDAKRFKNFSHKRANRERTETPAGRHSEKRTRTIVARALREVRAG